MMTDRVRERLEREVAARRTLFVAVLAGFAAVFGFVAVSGKPAPDAAAPDPALRQMETTAPRDLVIAEVPVANLNGDGVTTIIRIVAPETQTAAPYVRTRATP